MTSASKYSSNEFASVRPKMESLISDKTKQSFMSSSSSIHDYSQHPFNVTEHSDLKFKANYVPLLPKRHLDDFSDNTLFPDAYSSKTNLSNEKILNNPVLSSFDSNSTVPSSSLLSKVDVDDDIQLPLTCLASSSYYGDPLKSLTAQTCIAASNASFFNLTDKQPTNTLTSHHYDHAGGGDMSYSMCQSIEPFHIEEAKCSLHYSDTTPSDSSTSSTSIQTSSVQSSYIVRKPTFSSQDSARAAGYPIISKDTNQYNAHMESGNIVKHVTDPSANIARSGESSELINSDALSDRPKESENLLKWSDFHSHFSVNNIGSQKNSISPKHLQITERFNRLLTQLEAIKFESLQYNVFNHVEMSRAIEILKQVGNHKSSSNDTSTFVDSSKCQNDFSDLADHAKIIDNISKETRVPQNQNPSLLSNKTFSKSEAEFVENSSAKIDAKLGNVNSNGKKVAFKQFVDSTSVSAECETPPDLKSRKNLFLNSNNQSGFDDSRLQNLPVNYDAFSSNVKTSSTSSTPSKTTANNSTGFVLIDEKTPPGKLAKKKEQFLLGRLRKEEEHRKIQMEREIEAEKRKLDAKQQQEKLIQKKQEEKEKRVKIFKEYQKRKLREEKAALRSPGVIGSKSPSSYTKKNTLSKVNSYSSDHVHLLGRSGANPSTNNLTVPASARTVTFAPFHANEEDTDSLESIGSTEYTGPKLFKHLRSKSNRTLITNAINHCCLSGKVNEKQRNKTLAALENNEARHLMVLFRDNNCQFRALYSYHPDEEKLHKICGTGPNIINPSMIDALFKYNSGRRTFVCIPSKTLSVSIDGITIKNSLWQHAIKK